MRCHLVILGCLFNINKVIQNTTCTYIGLIDTIVQGAACAHKLSDSIVEVTVTLCLKTCKIGHTHPASLVICLLRPDRVKTLERTGHWNSSASSH